MLKLRILTALILIPLVIIGIFYTSTFYFKFIAAAIMLLAAWEWAPLSGYTALPQRFLYVGLQAAILFFVLPYLSDDWILQCGLVFWLLLSVYLIWARNRSQLPMITPVISAILGWLIISLCWVSLQRLQLTPIYLLFMLLVVCLSDTAAYISGRLWGRHLLAATLSPNKTWEGFIVGLLFTWLSAIFIKNFIELKLTFWQLGLLVLLTNLAAVAGDLFESQLKRLRGLKDSGQLLPGHGGILDRVDSLLAAAPVFSGSLLLLGLVT